ncbi:thiol-disulfide isomerase/thioredoxin [Haloferula luteola]|uniref:Thiol-disulfide isomerase/thioredoxin n=1 Tax=Haloferula luteola TaxID=595692 RepID=A0A840VDX1_9BACT|nr:thioredoxin-like domain-containing protein [Haloferula luteola]MBB5352029.1 thiol-disulfide isomerase/thioredoxin [Haloferula luteola]
MKTILLLLATIGSGLATAGFESWTNSEGKSVELELISKVEKDGDTVGTFRMRNGKTVEVAATQLSDDSAAKLKKWSAEAADFATATPELTASVFDDVLDGNLIKLDGKHLKRCKDFVQPTKYYLFYYTASWCGPCHKFTPSLVEFYNEHKNAEFEVVLITSDSNEDDMEEYAEEMAMPWPQLKLSKASKFKKEFRHPGTGIPNLVLTDLQGKLLKTSYEGENYVGPTVVMNHLAGLLKD